MLWMIQRVFYGKLGLRPEEVQGWDISPREHVELWPLAILFLVMGIFSPFWTKAIDQYSQNVARAVQAAGACPLAQHCNARLVMEPGQAPTERGKLADHNGFVDPDLAAAALHKQAPAKNKGARY
jgi:NADH-quinone oxidoreductase subunit M